MKDHLEGRRMKGYNAKIILKDTCWKGRPFHKIQKILSTGFLENQKNLINDFLLIKSRPKYTLKFWMAIREAAAPDVHLNYTPPLIFLNPSVSFQENIQYLSDIKKNVTIQN